MNLPQTSYAAALRRAQDNKELRRCALQHLLARNPLQVEPDEDRRIRRVMRRVGVDRATAEAIVDGADPATLKLSRQQAIIATTIGGTVDFLPMSFLAGGRRAANAVGRLVTTEETAVGTCFMISKDLLVTNHHVIGTPEFAREVQVEFELETDESETPIQFARFELEPGFFLFGDSPELDFTVVALGKHVRGTAPGSQRTFCRISGRNDKHALGEFVNIIQHPDGGSKQVVVRENRLVDRPVEGGVRPVLQYMADTLESSSGSPVFNDTWDVVALHHSSVKAGTITVGGQTRADIVNEGTRASVIVEALRSQEDKLTDDNKRLLQDALKE